MSKTANRNVTEFDIEAVDTAPVKTVTRRKKGRRSTLQSSGRFHHASLWNTILGCCRRKKNSSFVYDAFGNRLENSVGQSPTFAMRTAAAVRDARTYSPCFKGVALTR